MKIILSHPTGNANVRALAVGLAKANMLYSFYTSIALVQGNLLDKISAFEPFHEFRRRRLMSSLKPFIRLWPWWEIGRLLSSKAGFRNLIEHEKGLFSIDAVYQSLDKHVASALHRVSEEEVELIYAYEDGAIHSFREAKRLSRQCLYDLPIGYWRAARCLLENERERWPEWSATLTGFKDSSDKLARKDEELSLADQIFVASRFTATTLKDYPGCLAPIHIVPYGFPPVVEDRRYERISNSRSLKLLFVGGLSQRKGIANLFAAADYFGKRVELTVVGNKAVPDCIALNRALEKHTWIPSMSHEKVLQLMQRHDVLVFPSLFEGFGLVISEAMSQGTPVITTERTAGPDLIKHNQNGWLVEAGSTQQLIGAIEQLIDRPQLVNEVGQAALETARQRPWSVYGKELAEVILKSQPTKIS